MSESLEFIVYSLKLLSWCRKDLEWAIMSYELGIMISGV